MSYEAWGEPDSRPWPHPNFLPACMGWHCNLRDTCARYHQPVRREDPAERLCGDRNELWVAIAPRVAA